MPFSDQLFSSFFPASKIRELEDVSSKAQAEIKDDIDGMKQRFDDLAVCNKQLGIMFTALYQLLIEKNIITKEEFKKQLDSINLSDWV